MWARPCRNIVLSFTEEHAQGQTPTPSLFTTAYATLSQLSLRFCYKET